MTGGASDANPEARGSGCPKCGATDIHTVYHAQGCSDESCRCAECSYGSHAKEHREHLHRSCRGCGFDWISPTLDTPLIRLGSSPGVADAKEEAK